MNEMFPSIPLEPCERVEPAKRKSGTSDELFQCTGTENLCSSAEEGWGALSYEVCIVPWPRLYAPSMQLP